MQERAQSSVEYLLAIVLSFFLTLIVLSSVVNLAYGAKESLECNLGKCSIVKKAPAKNGFLSSNDLVFISSIIVFYFIEFSIMLLFLRFIARPEKKKIITKSQY